MGSTLRILAVIGTQSHSSVTRMVINEMIRRLERGGCFVDRFDYLEEPLALFNPETSPTAPGYDALKQRVDAADVLLLGTPDYHGGMSGALKNFLDHFWHEFAGKLIVTVVASHDKGLTATDQLRTVARQCYAWTLPYGLSFSEAADIKGRKPPRFSEALTRRMEMTVRDMRVYGNLLARQRRADLAGNDPGFMARLRIKRTTSDGGG